MSSFNIYYPADPCSLDNANELISLSVKIRKLQIPFENRVKYLCNLIADQYSFRFKFSRVYKSSWQWIALENNPVTVGVELNPKHKKLPLIDAGIFLPNGEVHLWDVKSPLQPLPDETVQDFLLPFDWIYNHDGDEIKRQLKEGRVAWNKLSKQEKAAHLEK